MALKFYEYKACSTCQKAKKWLEKNKIPFEALPIVDQPPSSKELKAMLSYLREAGGDLKNLFNTSGEMYRNLKISERFKEGWSESEALQLLAKNGKLIKRPFVIDASKGTVGFKEDVWKKMF